MNKLYPIPSFSVLAFSALAIHAHGDVIYSETFDNNTAGNLGSSSIGWSAYVGAFATDISGTIPNGGDRMGVADIPGNPSSDGDSYFFASNTGNTQDISWTGIETGLSLSNVSSISWRMGNATTATTVKILVQIGGSWYASSSDFSNSSTYTGGTFSSAGAADDVLQEFTFSTDAEDWLELTLNPGVTMSLGSAPVSDLSSSTITGLGFYVDTNNTFTTARLDTLQVNSIPEASVFALYSALSVMALVFTRRRRN
ncbi:hypothetical protein SH580_06010 [Coraliomargarita algicola]|uniref:PEP-CTERM protein-sorting domain-containing protein n=1 Tax=Coraliomargarita algicola TaxID=3092156 RepID=A0ABZ0RPB0_9BACT|nr:hypothetical protein [Coraliomargarita sp. J2-16]WPJ97261.1 hypothetical protein SH580_06010 [Coraliomargarita sp. J2-16]